MKLLILFTFLLAISVQGFAQPANDLMADAIELQHALQWQSADAAYSNIESNFDGTSSCGYGSGNVWFKFQAITNEVDIRLLTTGNKGTLEAPIITLFNSDLSQALGCYGNAVSVAYIQTVALVPGNWYFLSVDSRSEGSEGTFSLSLKNQMDFDFRAKAVTLLHSLSWSSADAAYSNVGATFDGSSSCGYGSGNVWFKFLATTKEVDLRLLTTGNKGSMTVPIITLFNNDLSQVMGCYTNGVPVAYIQTIDLTPGTWYFIAVDTHFEGVQGTFSLSMTNLVSNDLQAKAEEIQHLSQWCSEANQYSTIDATNDGTTDYSSCLPGSNNVWFQFKATSTTVAINLTSGTIVNPYVTLGDKQANNVLICKGIDNTGTISMEYSSLTIGSWYLIAVGDWMGTTGTFSFCLNGGAAATQLCENIYCDSNGGVGIGTPNVPIGYRMSVNGKIIAEGVKVEAKSKWPDYVFEKGYELKELNEVKTYINENGHLPEIPAAAVIEKEGIDLGTMNSLLLKKMEEMTLYMIQLEERVKELEGYSAQKKY